MSRFNIIQNIYKLIYDRFDVISMKTGASLVHFLETGQSNWLKDSCRNANDGKTSVPVGTGACCPAAALNKQTNKHTNKQRWCRDADGWKTFVPGITRACYPATEKSVLVQKANKSSNRIKSSENAWSTKMFREGTLGWAPSEHPSVLCTLGKAHHPPKITVSLSVRHLGQVIKIQVWNQN